MWVWVSMVGVMIGWGRHDNVLFNGKRCTVGHETECKSLECLADIREIISVLMVDRLRSRRHSLARGYEDSVAWIRQFPTSAANSDSFTHYWFQHLCQPATITAPLQALEVHLFHDTAALTRQGRPVKRVNMSNKLRHNTVSFAGQESNLLGELFTHCTNVRENSRYFEHVSTEGPTRKARWVYLSSMEIP